MDPIVNQRVVEPSQTVSEDIYLVSMLAEGDIENALLVSLFDMATKPHKVKDVKVHRARIIGDDRRRSMREDYVGKVRVLEARLGDHVLEDWCTDRSTGINNFVFYPTKFINDHCRNKRQTMKEIAATLSEHGLASQYMELGMALNLIAYQYQQSAMTGMYHQHRMELLDNLKQQAQDNFPELIIEEHRLIADGPIFYKLRKQGNAKESDNEPVKDEDE
ncbi:hypothetical protein NFI00_000211 [Salmonella enterica]|nr:hypothetical protein [Salmonella enterica]